MRAAGDARGQGAHHVPPQPLRNDRGHEPRNGETALVFERAESPGVCARGSCRTPGVQSRGSSGERAAEFAGPGRCDLSDQEVDRAAARGTSLNGGATGASHRGTQGSGNSRRVLSSTVAFQATLTEPIPLSTGRAGVARPARVRSAEARAFRCARRRSILRRNVKSRLPPKARLFAPRHAGGRQRALPHFPLETSVLPTGMGRALDGVLSSVQFARAAEHRRYRLAQQMDRHVRFDRKKLARGQRRGCSGRWVGDEPRRPSSGL